jgi:hypothetical protein
MAHRQIVRSFVKLRELLLSHEALARRVGELEKHTDRHTRAIISIMRELEKPPKPVKKHPLGFHADKGQLPGRMRSNEGKIGTPGGDRTLDPKIKSLLLYQLSYRRTAIGGRNLYEITFSCNVPLPLRQAFFPSPFPQSTDRA